MSFFKRVRITPAQTILLGFFFLILGGTLLLMLPCATSGPGGAPFLDALFTATSATCVTGLVIHDTALYWAPFGQVVLLLLIQIGGMGVVTMAVAIFMFSGRKISLKQRWVMQESISAPRHAASGAAFLPAVRSGEGIVVCAVPCCLRLLQCRV